MKYIITRITTDAEGKTSVTNTVKETLAEAKSNLYFQASQIFDNLAPSDAVVLMDSNGNRIEGINCVRPVEVAPIEETTEEKTAETTEKA